MFTSSLEAAGRIWAVMEPYHYPENAKAANRARSTLIPPKIFINIHI